MSDIRFNRWLHQSGTGGIHQDSSGSIGIGTDDPTTTLEVATSVAGVSTAARFRNTSRGGTSQTVDIQLGLQHTVESNVILRAGKEANHNSGAATDNFFAIHTTENNISSEKLRITSSGNIGIGTDNPERTLSVAANNPMIQIEGTGGSGKQWTIISSDDTTGAAAASRGGNFVIYDDTSGGLGDVLTLTGVGGSMGLGVQNPGAKLHVSGGNIKVDDGYGIDFSATADGSGTTTSELLDDYEEGTWTPTSKQGTLSGASAGTYTKVGNLCTITAYVTGFSDRTSSDAVEVQGLPFSAAASDAAVCPVMIRYVNNTNGSTALTAPVGYLATADTSLRVYQQSAQGDVNYDSLKYEDIDSTSASIRWTLTYITT